MADINNNPKTYIDMNELFPVLNKNVGLNHQQLRTIMENSNYLKNNSIAQIAVGNVDTIIVSDPSQADIKITAREATEDGKKVTYLDIVLYIPSGNVESVNGKTGIVELTAQDVGAVQAEIDRRKITNSTSETSMSYASKTNAGTLEDAYGSSVQVSQSGITITAGGGSYINQGIELYNAIHVLRFTSDGQLLVDGLNIATQNDITNAIGNVSALLGDTDDLEV